MIYRGKYIHMFCKFTPHFKIDIISYACCYLSWTMLVKGAPGVGVGGMNHVITGPQWPQCTRTCQFYAVFNKPAYHIQCFNQTLRCYRIPLSATAKRPIAAIWEDEYIKWQYMSPVSGIYRIRANKISQSIWGNCFAATWKLYRSW